MLYNFFLAIVGQMSSGKSFLSQQIIKNLNDITYSNFEIKETKIIFISKSNESAKVIENICQKNNFKFTWWKIIHSMDFLMSNENNNNTHIIILMEDIASDINGANNKFNSDMSSFLFRSRHYNISIIYILHGIGHSMTKKNSFERIFLDNSSGLFIFKPINNKKIIFNYIKKFLSKNACNQLDNIFDFATKLMSHPYIFIQPNKNLYDEIGKIRIDIFNENIFLQSGI